MTTLADPHAVFAAGLAAADNQPQRAYEALRTLTNAVVGTKLFTILALDHDNGVMHRLYSDTQDLYPTPGSDAIGDTVWERTIIGQRTHLVLNTADALAAVLPEHPALFERDLKSMLNLPIVVAGVSIGTLNMLNVEGHFTAEVIETAYSLTAAAAAVLLMSRETAA